MIAIGNDKLWASFCNISGREDLTNDPDFSTNAKRTENYSKIKPVCDEIILSKTSQEWEKLFEENGIPFTTINNIDKVVNNPQVLAREMIVDVEHPVAGAQKLLGIPIKLSKTPGEIYKAAPVLGEDNKHILTELGYSSDDILKFKKEGTI